MSGPMPDAEARPVPSAVLSYKIDNLAAEVLELRRELRGLVRLDLYEEGRRADQRRIELQENALRELVTQQAQRRWQLGLAVLAAVVSVILALVQMG